jgi:four helix bundle protein
MAKVEKFQDLRCWQESRNLVRAIYHLSDKGSFAQDFGIKDQIRRAVVSVMSNIAEGFSRFSKKDFIHFLNYSSSSLAEVQSLLYAALDLSYISNNEFQDQLKRTEKVKAQILALIKYLNKSKTYHLSEPFQKPWILPDYKENHDLQET